MHSQKLKIVIITVVAAVVLIGAWYFLKESANKTADQSTAQNPNTSSTSTQNIDDVAVNPDDYIGVISTSTDGKMNIYTNQKYGLRFSYPIGWRVGDNHLGYGTFQLFNYEESVTNTHFSEKQNKIEAGISDTNSYGVSSDYPEKTRQTRKVMIAGQTVNVDDVELVGGEKIHTYFIPIPTVPGKYLGISIYGDPSNFSVLDEIVQSLEWVK